jgi:peroxiredoxin
MKHGNLRLFLTLASTLLALACSSGPAEAQGQGNLVQKPDLSAPGRFGETFAGGTLTNLNTKAGGPATVNLDQVLGTRPVVLFYWIAGNPRADQVFQELQKLASELGSERLALYGLVYQRNERDKEAIDERVGSLGIKVPVLLDDDFKMGKRLKVQSVPNVTIFDAEGRLRLTNGASMVQMLEYKMTLADAVRRVGETGQLSTYGFLTPYYPVKELVGKRCPDVTAPLLTTKVEQRWSSMLAPDKLNVLIFWSIDCPHCRKTLPEINDWLKANGSGMNVIGAAKVTDEATRVKTKEFCDTNSFVFPTLIDQDFEIANLYQVTSTPTILFIRPDGVIDSVVLNAEEEFAKTAEAKKRALLPGA